MKTKNCILFLLFFAIMNIHLSYAQMDSAFSAEEFIAEVIYGYMTEKSPKVYIEKITYLPEMCGFKSNGKYVIWGKLDNENLCKKFGICDTLLYEFYDYIDQFESIKVEWNEKAPVFQQSKYKNLIFVDKAPVQMHSRKYFSYTKYSQPAFTKNREYAVIDVSHYSCHLRKSRLKWNWKKPWRIISREYQRDIAEYRRLYQRIDGKWVRIGEFLTTRS
jgi:hypothetical protein